MPQKNQARQAQKLIFSTAGGYTRTRVSHIERQSQRVSLEIMGFAVQRRMQLGKKAGFGLSKKHPCRRGETPVERIEYED